MARMFTRSSGSSDFYSLTDTPHLWAVPGGVYTSRPTTDADSEVRKKERKITVVSDDEDRKMIEDPFGSFGGAFSNIAGIDDRRDVKISFGPEPEIKTKPRTVVYDGAIDGCSEDEMVEL